MHDHTDHPLDCACHLHAPAPTDAPPAMAPNTAYDALCAPHIDSAAPVLAWRGRRIGHAKFLRLAARAANALAAAGLGVDDVVTVQVARSPVALALCAGAVQAGVIYAPPGAGRADTGLLISDTAGPKAGGPALTLSADGESGTFLDLMAAQEEVAPVTARGPGDTAALCLGPAGVRAVTHRALLAQARGLADLWAPLEAGP